ncbi:hypothetical protein KIPB_006163 [Kipferlia bialata]|uniref:Uncharacterized protein n=1 Tax=Kipferlia bialata TaxID=797122 RepID=A0A9K3GI05_9EUKA|nr:hypothetical protein KIPB_006163 [Kipferlia bialata]|eukprot:g6163.t1
MFDYFTLFSESGLVLWDSKEPNTPPEAVASVDSLVSEVFLKERLSQTSHDAGPFSLCWRLLNNFSSRIFCVVVYSSILSHLNPCAQGVLDHFSGRDTY